MSEQEEEKQYIKAFNNGYLMNMYQPELAAQLAKASGESITMSAFRDGREQLNSEKLREHRPSWLTGERPSKEESASNRSKNIEPER